MKNFKFKLFILSAILLTLSSGLLFYRNLFMSDQLAQKSKGNFEELRYLDLRINEQMALERRHLEFNSSDVDKNLNLAKNNIHDLISILLDLHIGKPQIKNSISKIETYFNDKSTKVTNFQTAIKELRDATLNLMPTYRELQKRNLKFSVDGKDFYRECIADVLWYLTYPTKDNENRLYEDKKILSQIIGIASKPEELIQKYSSTIDTIIAKNTAIEEIFSQVKQKSIDDEMAVVTNYFKDSKNSQNTDGQNFLVLVFVAIIIYVFSIIIILRKF